MRKPPRILLTGGGSGGHIIPNLAVASALKKQAPDAALLYIGSRNGLDEKLVAQAGIPFYGIFAGKLRRYFSWRNFVDPFLVIIGFFQSLFILISFWPDAVFSKGGFISLPVTFAAWILRRPIILHESDSRMGIANRMSSKLAKKVCVAFPELASTDDKFVLTGNPVRLDIRDGNRETGFRITGFTPNKPVILVWGGSQGARQINEMIEREFPKLKPHFQIIHVTGAGKAIDIKDPHYRAFDYLGDELKHIYAITDFVVGRAGANSLYELALVRKPNILIPLKNADQLKNAEYFEQKKASIVLNEAHSLADVLTALKNNPEQIEQMKTALTSVSRPDAAARISDIIISEIPNSNDLNSKQILNSKH
jgi:UDP-N-acetylglucosamine--N-acetylmuramyl-(pentapeptide) pyrophosphoryl-undecaprenol N-acetylglucosamine transferase